MYPEELVAPMRTDLTEAGFQEFTTPEEVESHLKDHKGTSLLVINSWMCGWCCPSRRWPSPTVAPDQLATCRRG